MADDSSFTERLAPADPNSAAKVPVSPECPLATGTQLARYRVLRPLGAGGMGEVYVAEDARLGRQVAVKVICRSSALSSMARARFEQEARAASALTHPNIITIYDIGDAGEQPFIVMELLDGHSTNATWTEDRLWDAYLVTAPAKVKGRSQAGRFADLVSLVRFALQQQPVLTPFADSVQERYERWLGQKEQNGFVFTAEQRAWLGLIRDHVATSLSHQVFGAAFPRLLDEALAA